MAGLGEVVVRISLEQSSVRFIDALAMLLATIDAADPDLLDQDVAEAAARLKASLQDRPIVLEEDI